MPFDVTTLNGVTFEDKSLTNPLTTQTGLRGYPYINDYVVGLYGVGTIPENGYLGTGVGPGSRDFFNPGTVFNAQTDYHAAFTNPDSNAKYLPTFGSIELTGYRPGGYQGDHKTLWIHGFGDDGQTLLLTPAKYQSVFSKTYENNEFVVSIYGGGAFFLRNTSWVSTDPAQAPTFPLTVNGDNQEFYVAPVCFAEGTRLATASGPVAVEALAVGDLIVTASGATRPITWIGQMLARPARHPRPHEVNPIRVRAHAFGVGKPAADLRLSPGHAVYVDGVLVPVGHLANGATIVQEAVEEVRYFHVELDSHDVLLAEGLPCESYLDDGNRASFTGAAGAVSALDGRLDPQSWDAACAPLVAAGPQLVEVQERLHAQAEALGWVRGEDAALHLVVDGVPIAPLHVAGNRYWFAAPAAQAVTLASNAGVLAEVMPGLADRRQLGVAVAELRIDGAAVALDDEVFGAGFHAIETHEAQAWRWTDGAATLALPGDVAAMIEVAVLIVAPTWTRAAPRLRVVSAA